MRNFVLGHLTSERSKGIEQPLSMALPSGEALKYGASRLTPNPDFRTFTGQQMECVYFWYCSRATGSYSIPWFVYHDEKGLGCSRLFTK